MLFFINVNQDLIDRALQEPADRRHLLHDDDTDEQSGNQLKDCLPPVTSACESIATAVGVAERALCQSSDLLRDIDSLLSMQPQK